MSAIILPVKCSTVKTLSGRLETVIEYEIVAVCILGVLWCITYNYYVFNNPSYINSLDYDATGRVVLNLLASWGGLMIAGLVAIVNDWPKKLYNLLPSLECIKDDEPTPPKEGDSQ